MGVQAADEPIIEAEPRIIEPGAAFGLAPVHVAGTFSLANQAAPMLHG
ncbi:MAG: hypothetical protein WCC60_06540 [Ilumatobacteraceae bacterium]